MNKPISDLINPNLYKDIQSIISNSVNFSMFENKTVLITGACHIVGYYLACAFLINNDNEITNTKVVAVDNDKKLIETYKDLTARSDIEFMVSDDYDSFGSIKADYIIHNDFIENNSNRAIIGLMKYINDNDVVSTVVNSPIDVYGTVYNGKSKISETDIGYIDLTSTKGSKAQSLRMTECIALNFAKSTDKKVVLTRSSFIYGVPLEKKHILSKIFGGKSTEKAINYTTNSEFTFNDYCYVTDCARALLIAMDKGSSGEIYNISSEAVATDKEIQEIIADNIDSQSGVTNKEKTLSPMEATQYILNIDKIKKLGYNPLIDLNNGYKRIATIIKSQAGE